jgi:hypothetical protein
MDLVFAFPDGSASFVNGFEAGAIWQQMDGEGALEIDCGFVGGFPVHTENVEVMRRMARARGYTIEVRPTDYSEWTALRFTWVGTDKAKPQLAIVSQPKDSSHD